MKAFISSTYLDLIEYRKAAKEALERLGQQVGGMEIFGARNEDPKNVAFSEIEQSDIFVGVYAHRYGCILKGDKLSITELEYHHAKSKNIPVFCFMISNKHPWLPEMMETNPSFIKKLSNFKSLILKEKTLDFFTTSADLGMKVGTSVGKYISVISDPRGPLHFSETTHSKPKVAGSTFPSRQDFFGRETELKLIESALSPEARTWGVLIDGPGGIGKTSLAIEASHKASADLFERKIFITAKVREMTSQGEKLLVDFSRNNYFSMLNELALELGEDGLLRLAPNERADLLRIALAGKKTLIVFDNLETLPEDERTRLFQFLSRLPEGNKSIVTSRRRTNIDARVIRLDRLSADEALQLIEALAQNNKRLEQENAQARRDLYEITNGNPLLIKWVCGQLGRQGSAMRTIADAYKFIINAPKNNDPLEYIFGDLLETFKPNEITVLAALTHFSRPAKLSWITNITGIPEKVAETVLEDLTDRSILTASAEGQEFFLPPLAAVFIRKRLVESVVEIGNHLAQQAYEMVMENGWTHYNRFPLLYEYWPIIRASFNVFLRSIDNKYVQNLCSALANFLNYYGFWDERIILFQSAEQIAEYEGDMLHAGERAYQIGFTYALRGQADNVLDCAKRAEKHLRFAEARLKANAIHLRGLAYQINKQFPDAIAAYKEMYDLCRGFEPESLLVANSLCCLANIEYELGNNDLAETNYLEALQISQKLKDKESTATILGNLAGIARNREEWNKAERLSRDALKISNKIKRIELIASDYYELAYALFRQGKTKRSLRYAKDSVAILSYLGSKDAFEAKELLKEIENKINIKASN